MKYQAAKNPAKFSQFAERVFGFDSGSDVQKADDGILCLKSWFEKVKSPTSLSSINVPESDIPKIAENAIGLAKIWRMQEYTAEKIEDILRLCV